MSLKLWREDYFDDNERCDACRFWVRAEDWSKKHKDDLPGNCRRFPPAFSSIPSEHWRAESWPFPVTVASNGCGEFKPKEEVLSGRYT